MRGQGIQFARFYNEGLLKGERRLLGLGARIAGVEKLLMECRRLISL